MSDRFKVKCDKFHQIKPICYEVVDADLWSYPCKEDNDRLLFNPCTSLMI